MAVKKVMAEEAIESADLAAYLARSTQFTIVCPWLVGVTPLIVHAWSQKAKQEMLSRQVKSSKPGKEARDPEADFVSSLYPLGDSYGFPATALKSAVTAVAHKDKGLPRSVVAGVLFVQGVLARVETAFPGAICDLPLVKLYADEPQMREDAVRVGSGLNKTASLAYRAQFSNWAIRPTIEFNSSVLSLEICTALLQEAGRSIGVGEWRPEKRGNFGTFRLATPEESHSLDAYVAHGGQFPIKPEIGCA